MIKHTFILLSLAFCLGLGSMQGQDTYLKYQSGENELRFRLLADGTLGVVNNPDHLYTGDVVVPASATINGKTYMVTALCGGGSGTYGEGSDATSAFNSGSVDSEGIKSITLPEGITYIANAAFHTVPIKELKMPSTVEFLGQMFSMNMVQSFVIPDKIETVLPYTFYIFQGLETLTFGPNVTMIEDRAFINCRSLKRLIFKSKVPPTLEKDPFDEIGIWDLSKITVYVPDGCIDAYKEAWPDFEFTYANMSSAGLNDNTVGSDDVKVYCNASGIFLKNVTQPTDVKLYDLLGRMIYSGTVECDTTIPLKLATSQIYILKANNKCTKLIVK